MKIHPGVKPAAWGAAAGAVAIMTLRLLAIRLDAWQHGREDGDQRAETAVVFSDPSRSASPISSSNPTRPRCSVALQKGLFLESALAGREGRLGILCREPAVRTWRRRDPRARKTRPGFPEAVCVPYVQETVWVTCQYRSVRGSWQNDRSRKKGGRQRLLACLSPRAAAVGGEAAARGISSRPPGSPTSWSGAMNMPNHSLSITLTIC